MEKREFINLLEKEFTIQEIEELLCICKNVIISKKEKEKELNEFANVLKKGLLQGPYKGIIENIDNWRKKYTGKFKDAKIFWEMYDIQFMSLVENINVDVKLLNPTIGDLLNGNDILDNKEHILNTLKKSIADKYLLLMPKWRKENNGIFKDVGIFWDKYNNELLVNILN